MSSQEIQTGTGRRTRATLVAVLLVAGIASSLLYVGGEVLASMSWTGYSYVNQAVSELAAIGAPTRQAMLWLFGAYNVLVVAFAAGVWRAADGRRGLKLASVALVVYAVVGQATQVFSPMNPRGSVATATDFGHMILTTVEVLSIVAFMAFASGAAGRGFRLYSILTIVALMAAGIAVGAQAGQMTAAAASTPFAGILERVNIYGTMLWVLALAATLLRARAGAAPTRPAARPVITGPAISMLSLR
jgi:hypothetical protein